MWTVYILLVITNTVYSQQEEYLATYLQTEYDPEASRLCNLNSLAAWEYNTNLTGEGNAAKVIETSLEYSRFQKKQWEEHFQGVNWRNITNQTLSRQLRFLTVLGTSALNDSLLTELNNITTTMQAVYSRAKICPFTKQSCNLASEGLSLDPQIEEILSRSRNYEELQYAWKAWRDATGPHMRDDYKKYVDINNAAAVINGMSDYGAMWREGYESDTFISEMDELWTQLEPLYTELHTYVLARLKDTYGDKLGDDGLIPANVLGNMWAQSWRNIYDLVEPFPNATAVDVTTALKDQSYNATRMFETSDEFYTSLGLPTNEVSFDEASAMIEKPTDGREVVCHASAWDFCDGKDFRIKMCTNVNMKDFVTVHHEMGHIQYYLQYKNLPITLRKGANPGFHEAVGDTIALSVSTPAHLQKIGLLSSDYKDSEQNDINSLMQMALDKVAFLPFGLLIDKWRWDVFSGKVAQTEWNTHWWRLREKYQKVKAPVTRSETDFDPGAKYHVPADSQYIAYFVAHVLQFQMHKSLCIAAGQYNASDPAAKPLHKCDIYQSKAAGDRLSAGLSLGGSKPWPEALEAMTGERRIDGSALLEYFSPLHQYLKRENEARNESPTASSQVVPIVVAAVLLALVVVVLVAYLVMRRRKARDRRRQESDDIAVTEIRTTSTEGKEDSRTDADNDKAENK